MEILGIGPLELFFIVVIALIILGPKDMVKAGKTIGRTLRKIVSSSSWHTIQQTSRDLKHLPNKLMSESGLDQIEKELGINEINKEFKKIEKEINTNQINQEIKKIEKDMKSDQINQEFKEIQKDISDWTTPPTDLKSEKPEDQKVVELQTDSESATDIDHPSQPTSNT